MGIVKKLFNCTRKPEGLLGELMVKSMNKGHAAVSDWGMEHILASEDRTKELRNPRASVREHLKQEPKQTAAKALTHKKKEPER